MAERGDTHRLQFRLKLAAAAITRLDEEERMARNAGDTKTERIKRAAQLHVMDLQIEWNRELEALSPGKRISAPFNRAELMAQSYAERMKSECLTFTASLRMATCGMRSVLF